MGKYGNLKHVCGETRGQGRRIGIVLARFNHNIGEGLLSACSVELGRNGVANDDITLVSVPGALEIPFALRQLALSGRFDALIALGAVIRGETYHFEVVAGQSAHGVMQVQLECGVPVANGILTTTDDDQALARMSIKGAEVARVALEMADLAQQLGS